MLLLGKIITKAWICFEYSKLATIPLKIYDRNQYQLTEKDFNFGRQLFAKNPNSCLKFRHILDSLLQEKHLLEKFSAWLTDDILVIYWPLEKSNFLILF